MGVHPAWPIRVWVAAPITVALDKCGEEPGRANRPRRASLLKRPRAEFVVLGVKLGEGWAWEAILGPK